MHPVLASPKPRIGSGNPSISTVLGTTLISLSLLLATPTPGTSQGPAGTITLPATTKVRLDLEVPKTDGSLAGLTLGHLGGSHGSCGGASRGFLTWTEPDGTVLWHRSQQPPKGTCSDPTVSSLFEGFPVLDGGPVLSSDVRAAMVVPGSGRIVATGEVRLAWQDPLTSGVIHTARGAFLGLWERDGQLVRGHYFGRIPDGPGLPDGDCVMVCDDGDSGDGWGDGEAWGSRHLAVAGNEITVVGWYRPDPDDPANPPLPHLWVQRFTDDLAIPLWEAIDLGGPPMTPRRAVVDSAGRTFVAGTGQGDPTRSDFDGVLARLASDGTVDRRRSFGGDLDDEATDLTLETDGTLRAEGFFTDQIEVAGLTLGGPGQGRQDFHAWLDEDLVWTGAGALSLPHLPGLRHGAGFLFGREQFPFAAEPTGGSFDKIGDDHPAIPIAYQVMEGTEQRGQLEQIDASDDEYLRIVASNRDVVELRVHFDPDPHDRQALYLDRVRVELSTLFCYYAQILVKGMVSEEFVVAGERSLCPSEDPILEIDVPEDLSDALGYDGSTYVDPEHRLVVALRIEFGPDAGQAKADKNVFYANAEEDTSVDHVEVIVEY